jgi:integrase
MPDGKVRRLLRHIPIGTKKEFPTKRLAERRMEVLVSHVNSFSYRPGRIATVEEFARRWETEVLARRKDSTIHTCKSHLKIQILPHLGKLRLDELSVENQQVFVNRITGTISRRMLVNVLATLSSMLRTARDWKYNCEPIDISRLVLPERTPKTMGRVFTAEQIQLILRHAQGQYRVMFAIAALAGLRVGEILALKTEDFDFARKLLFVRRSVWRGKLQATKSTYSEAVLPLVDALAEVVRLHIATLPKGQEFLFLTIRGTHFIAENVVRQGLTPLLDALKIPRCGFHAFRHAHTSLLLQTGATPPVVQAQLRHADPRVTIGLYGHIVGEGQRKAVEDVSNLFADVLNTEPITLRIQ